MLIYKRDILFDVRRLFIVLISAALIQGTVFFTGCLFDAASEPLILEAVSTEKDTYAFGEAMNITVRVKASDTFDNVTITLKGIQNTIGDYKLKRQKIVQTSPGTTDFIIKTKIPTCSSCTKLEPGDYFVITTLSYEEEEIGSKTLDITLYE